MAGTREDTAIQALQPSDTAPWLRLASGATLIVIGLAIILLGWRYPFGTLAKMGPGFLPFYLAVGIVALGVAVMVVDLRQTGIDDAEPVHWRGLVFLCAAIVLFGGMVGRAGLVPAMFLAVSVSMLADPQAKPLGILIYAAVMTLLGWLLFIQALGLPLSAFWT
jgi:hypothetical protein